VKTLRVLVADDEQLARKRVARLLSEMDGVVVCAECASADEAIAAAKRERVDVAVLDVEMPGMSGMDAAALVAPHVPVVIFCTAHANYAAQAFDRGAIDYVLKPVDAARLRVAIERARERLAHDASRQVPAQLAIPTTTGIALVDPQSISHAVLDGALVTIFTADGATFLTSDSLAELEGKLPHMIRVHRRALVALDHVARLESIASGGYVAHTKRGHAIEVSRQSARDLRKKLGLRGETD